jgi:sugar phosphate isomerase/epimerase
MFKPVQTAQEAEKLLKEHEDLRFLPDTAHLTIAGEDVLELLERNMNRLVGVHLKDWASEFGRSYQFYSRGFGVQFGYGDVRLSEIMEFLKSKKYNGWIVVEQDVADDPPEAVRNCREWLRGKHGI